MSSFASSGFRRGPGAAGGTRYAASPGCAPGPAKPRHRVASIGTRIPACPPTTRSPASTTRGLGAWSRTCRSTSRRRCAPAGRCSSSASAPGGSRCRSPRRAIRVVGVDLSAGMLEVARERAELAGAELDLRQGDMRDPPVDGGAFPLVICPFRSLLHMETDADRRLALRAVSRGCRAGTGPSRLRRLHARRPTTSPTRTGAGSSASPGSGSEPTGTRRRGRSSSGSAATEPRRRCRSRGSRSPSGGAARRRGLRRRRALRLVRPLTVARRRRLGLGVPEGRRCGAPQPSAGTCVAARCSSSRSRQSSSLIGLNAGMQRCRERECPRSDTVPLDARLRLPRRGTAILAAGTFVAVRRRSVRTSSCLRRGAAIVFVLATGAILGWVPGACLT